MIKVFYDGIGVAGSNKLYFSGVESASKFGFCRVSQEFFLPDIYIDRLKNIGQVKINCLIFKSSKINFPYHDECNLFMLANENHKTEWFEIVKGQDIYTHPNGNALKLIFDDDAPPNDIVLNDEKPLSETESRANLNVIYGLLEMLKKTGKSQNEIISELEKFDYFGMSESNLKKLFAKANNINKREH